MPCAMVKTYCLDMQHVVTFSGFFCEKPKARVKVLLLHIWPLKQANHRKKHFVRGEHVRNIPRQFLNKNLYGRNASVYWYIYTKNNIDMVV